MVHLTVTTEDGRIASFDVDGDASLENLRMMIEAELQIPGAEQELLLDGAKLKTRKERNTVRRVGLTDNCLLMVKRRRRERSGENKGEREGGRGDIRDRVGLFGLGRRAGGGGGRRQNFGGIPLPTPGGSIDTDLDIRKQRQIEEQIRQENIAKNFEAALEHNPESFGSVVMLYVDAKVNGHPVKAFVDSGAQTTIISKHCAQRCGILRLIDTRFRGIARGVGTARILGRVHSTVLKIGNEFLQCSFTVMEDRSLELLFGLDMLRKHQACIDLQRNVLKIGDSAVPFLPEKDIPKFDDSPFAVARGVSTDPLLHEPQRSSGDRMLAANNAASSTLDQPSINGLSARPYPRSAIDRLISLGFAESEVIQALDDSNGDENFAATILAQSKYGF